MEGPRNPTREGRDHRQGDNQAPERYRSGHNGTDSKSVGGIVPHVGSTGSPGAIRRERSESEGRGPWRGRAIPPARVGIIDRETIRPRRGTEAVITAPTRNRLGALCPTWVRIPPSPPYRPKAPLQAGFCVYAEAGAWTNTPGSTNRQDSRSATPTAGRRTAATGPRPAAAPPARSAAFTLVESRACVTRRAAPRNRLPAIGMPASG